MSLASDIKILYHLAVRPIRGQNHAERMDNFYAGQAEGYDDFRRRLLPGRNQMWGAVDVPSGGRWVDMGGGTGSNLELFGDSIHLLDRVYVVDLASSLLELARRRATDRGWHNVEIVKGDATRFQPPQGPVDVVTFSYSLSMIPDWFAAIENAIDMLRPGGLIGVVDFYVSRKHPAVGMRQHTWFTRTFWPVWMSNDNVFPSPEHVPFLHHHFEPLKFAENFGKVPYLPIARIPYFVFVGQKRV